MIVITERSLNAPRPRVKESWGSLACGHGAVAPTPCRDGALGTLRWSRAAEWGRPRPWRLGAAGDLATPV